MHYRRGIGLIVVLLLIVGWVCAPGRLEPAAALAAQAAEVGPQQVAPTPTPPGGASGAKRRDMTGAVLALTLLCVLNAIGLGVMIGLSRRMQTVAEEALKQKRRGR